MKNSLENKLASWRGPAACRPAARAVAARWGGLLCLCFRLDNVGQCWLARQRVLRHEAGRSALNFLKSRHATQVRLRMPPTPRSAAPTPRRHAGGAGSMQAGSAQVLRLPAAACRGLNSHDPSGALYPALTLSVRRAVHPREVLGARVRGGGDAQHLQHGALGHERPRGALQGEHVPLRHREAGVRAQAHELPRRGPRPPTPAPGPRSPSRRHRWLPRRLRHCWTVGAPASGSRQAPLWLERTCTCHVEKR